MESALPSPKSRKKIQCPVCKKEKPFLEIFAGSVIRLALYPYIQKYQPEWTPDQVICLDCLNRVRSDFVESTLAQDRGELSEAEQQVIDAIRNHELVAESPDVVEEQTTTGDRVADKLAEIGGSWRFIIGFGIVLVCWITYNSIALLEKPFDPYPFILLNLILSCLAALQAPVIMMSQNRQDAKDRLRSEADYKTNLKAELEIRHLHIKLDQLISHQWQKLLEIQQVQVDLMKDSMKKP